MARRDARHDRPRSMASGSRPRSWEHWIAHYEAQGLPRARAGLPGLRGRGRGAQRRPVADRGASPCRRSSSTSRPSSAGSRRRRSSWATRPAACSPRSCSTTASAPPASRSTRRRPRASSVVPLSQIKATFPVLKNPANRHAVGFTPEQWHYAFTNTFSEEESRRSYERYHVPASGAIFWGSALANIHPGTRTTPGRLQERRPRAAAVHLRQRRPPDAAGIQQSNAKHYKSDTVTEVKEFDGRTCCRPQPGWEEVADYALDWALEHARAAGEPGMTGGAHHAHRRADGPDRGRRLAAADRPDVRPARPALPLRLGHGVAQARRAGARGRRPRRRSTRSCSATTTTATTSTTPAARCCPSAGRRRDDRVRRAAARRRARAGCSRGRRRGSRRRAGRRSRSRRRRAATGRRCSRPIVGDVIGFALRWEGQQHGVLWISGDTVLYDGVREVADRLDGRRRAPAPRRRAVPGHRAAALHDDRARGGRAVRARAPAHRDPGPLRGLDALPRGPRRDRARARARARGGPRARPLAGARGAHRIAAGTFRKLARVAGVRRARGAAVAGVRHRSKGDQEADRMLNRRRTIGAIATAALLACGATAAVADKGHGGGKHSGAAAERLFTLAARSGRATRRASPTTSARRRSSSRSPRTARSTAARSAATPSRRSSRAARPARPSGSRSAAGSSTSRAARPARSRSTTSRRAAGRDVPDGPGGFLNDVTVTRSGDVYVTDSFRPTLWHVTAAQVRAGSGTPTRSTSRAIPYEAGEFNVNGIVAKSTRRLVVVDTNSGGLFRITLSADRNRSARSTRSRARRCRAATACCATTAG